ncbi:uncharacterized protein LOC134968754 [Pseudophryne corroboree]|uniref:uncharacterized protein LOC134968754 n=1 Tax=Pseudophryne corroboree TaxID=495146 RepID=UPI003081A22B
MAVSQHMLGVFYVKSTPRSLRNGFSGTELSHKSSTSSAKAGTQKSSSYKSSTKVGTQKSSSHKFSTKKGTQNFSSHKSSISSAKPAAQYNRDSFGRSFLPHVGSITAARLYQHWSADALVLRNVRLETSCLVLTHSAVIQKISCLQQNGFICQTERQSCNMEPTHQFMTSRGEEHVKSNKKNIRKTKRSVESDSDIPDLLNMAQQLANTPTIGGNNLTVCSTHYYHIELFVLVQQTEV